LGKLHKVEELVMVRPVHYSDVHGTFVPLTPPNVDTRVLPLRLTVVGCLIYPVEVRFFMEENPIDHFNTLALVLACGVGRPAGILRSNREV
jgi:hypothetical protein